MKASLLQWGFFFAFTANIVCVCGVKTPYISVYKWSVLAYKNLGGLRALCIHDAKLRYLGGVSKNKWLKNLHEANKKYAKGK